ncbi:hypothetical protein SDC9_112682 [bioreactor metagenome]|uniref:Uncharacterized protein n=1 Tax=bioreactor metagenome TaxID=1076179 RepID=A0A645BJZ2_9ZZZZ
MDNTGIQPALFNRVQHRLRGHRLRSAVPANHFFGVKLIDLFDLLTFGNLGNGAGAADIDQLFAFGVIQAGVNHVLSSADVDVDQFLIKIRIYRHHAGAMNGDRLRARREGEKAIHGGGIA